MNIANDVVKHLNFTEVKKIITTLAMALMLGTQLHAQSRQTDDSGEFSLRYKVNLARLISTYDNNHTELVKLHQFMDDVVADEDKSVVRIAIWGYASPDGNATTNERLATARAVDCCEYLRKEYPMLDEISCGTKGIAQKWSDTNSAVEKSSIPMKNEVLEIVDSKQSGAAIEQKLRSMPAVWNYMKSSILPPMRCVEVNIVQQSNKPTVAQKPTPKPKPTVVEEVVVVNNYYLIPHRDRSELLAIENCTNAPLDFPRDKHRNRDKFKITFHR